jgi:hypothetical protein
MIGAMPPNPLGQMGAANPGAMGMGAPTNPLVDDPMKPKNPWETYSPLTPTMG